MAAEGEVLHWLDSDMLVEADHVAAQLRWHDLLDHAVVLGHKWFVDPAPLDGVDPAAVRDAVAAGSVADYFAGQEREGHAWVEELYARTDDLREAGPRAHRAHVGATASLFRALYLEAGGMDVDLKLGEDSALGYRLAECGAVFVPDREARSWHLGPTHVMRRQDEVNDYNFPFLADRIPDGRVKRATVGRQYAVPYVEVVLDSAGESHARRGRGRRRGARVVGPRPGGDAARVRGPRYRRAGRGARRPAPRRAPGARVVRLGAAGAAARVPGGRARAGDAAPDALVGGLGAGAADREPDGARARVDPPRAAHRTPARRRHGPARADRRGAAGASGRAARARTSTTSWTRSSARWWVDGPEVGFAPARDVVVPRLPGRSGPARDPATLPETEGGDPPVAGPRPAAAAAPAAPRDGGSAPRRLLGRLRALVRSDA